MRINLACLLLIFSLNAPVLAQNYSVQQAPEAWGLPKTKAEIKPEPVYVGPSPSDIDETSNTGKILAKENTDDFDMALSCAASLQIAALAAPQWSSEKGVIIATNLWLERVFALAEENGKAGEKVGEIVKNEMEKQTNESMQKPDALSKRAFACAANPPQ